MNITNVLLAIILFILVKQFYPDTAETLVAVGIIGFVLYAGYWLVTQFPTRWKERRAEKRQEEQDEREFWDYQKKHDAVRAKYDPRNEWNEATSVPNLYLEEIRKLNLEHRGMLQRRNGWTADDFNE
jgi:hypothetical protein